MKRVLYVGENDRIQSRLKPDWELGTHLHSSDLASGMGGAKNGMENAKGG